SLTGDLLHDVIRYRFVMMEDKDLGSWGETNELLLEKSIDQRFNYIDQLIRNNSFAPRPNLGGGFTSLNPIPPDITPAYKLWGEIAEPALGTNKENLQLLFSK